MAEVIDRDTKQLQAAELWLESNRKNSLLIGTGVGKSRIAMLIIGRLWKMRELTKDSKILLLVDSENLRDVNWKADFEKWGFAWVLDYTTIECYQTVYKWSKTKWDLVIADEGDFSLTEEYSKFYKNNEYSMLLMLTGTVDESKELILNTIAPPVMEYSTQDAQKDGILNPTQLVFIEYNLSPNKRDIKVNYKKGGQEKHFYQSENDAYAFADAKVAEIQQKLKVLSSDSAVIAGLDDKKVAELKSLTFAHRAAISRRRDLLWNGIASKRVTGEVISKILANENSKVITFSMLTAQADKLNEYTFHAKNKKGNTYLDDLSIGDIRSVGVCKAINRGRNLVGVNNLIMESYDGSPTSFAQRHGRGCRLDANRTMYLFVLLPYYYRKTSDKSSGGSGLERVPTQMVTWAKEMMADFTFTNPITLQF